MSGRPTSWSQVPLVLSVEEAAEILQIGRNGCYALVASGQLAVVRIRRRIVVPRQSLEKLLGDADVLGTDPPSIDNCQREV